MDIKYLTVVLVCISLLANDVEHLFLCSLAVSVSSMENCLFKSFPHFDQVICVFIVGLQLFVCLFYIFWILDPYQIHDLQTFSPLCRSPFLFPDSVLGPTKAFNFEVCFINLFFDCLCF